MRSPFLVVLLITLGCADPTPTAEYASAMDLYRSTITATLDTTHTAPEFDAVVIALRAVPRSNPKEQEKAERLAATIEGVRAGVRARGAAPGWIEGGRAAPPATPQQPAPTTTRDDAQGKTKAYLDGVGAP